MGTGSELTAVSSKKNFAARCLSPFFNRCYKNGDWLRLHAKSLKKNVAATCLSPVSNTRPPSDLCTCPWISNRVPGSDYCEARFRLCFFSAALAPGPGTGRNGEDPVETPPGLNRASWK